MKERAKAIVTGLLVFLLAVMAGLSFTACGDKAPEDKDPPAPPPAEATVTGLVIDTPPAKTSYYLGETVDLSGILLKAVWSDGVKSPVDIAKCTVSPSGELTADRTEITITYENVSVEQPITVKNVGVSSIEVATGNTPLKGSVNTPMDFSGIVVTATYADGESRAIKSFEVSTGGGSKIQNLAEVTFAERGTHTLTVTYAGASASFDVEIFNGFIIEAENIIETDKITEADKNFVERVKNSESGAFGKKENANEPASGGAYMGSIFKGAVMSFHISVEDDCYANIILRASSGYMTEGVGWSPLVMGDMQFNKLFDIRYGSADALETLYVEDEVVLKGSSTDNADGDYMLWVNWMDVDFGTLPLKAGDNIIQMEVISDYVNYMGASCACNIDRLEIEYTDDYTPPATVTGLTVKTSPAKTEYVAGESFDPTGMVVEAAFSDGTTKTPELAACEIVPAGALSADDAFVTITYRGASVTQAITVSSEKLFIEAENIIAKPAETDKNYVEVVQNGYQGTPAAKATEDESAPTSGGRYLGGMFSGAIVRFHIASDTDRRANIVIYVSSCNVTTAASDGNPWHPTEMGDVQFNRVYAAKFGAADAPADLPVSDDVIVRGGEGKHGTDPDMSLWENWRAISLGTVELAAGDNILEITNINTEMTNLAGEIFGLNIDRLELTYA